VIVAGGKGTRMGRELPKQFLPLGGKPLLMHTLDKFQASDPDCELILVLPSSEFELWRSLIKKHSFDVSHSLVQGGQSRFQSVKNGISSISSDEGLVAIHDGVRPFVTKTVIKDAFETAQKEGSAIPVVTLKDSIRKVEDGNSIFQDRNQFRLVQTPQTFRLEEIKKAFEAEELDFFTDDATVYEHSGKQVTLIEGNRENIKITTPEDLDYAEYLLRK